MKILPLTNSICKPQNNYVMQCCKPKPTVQPNFQGGLNNSQMDKIVNILAKKNTEVIERMILDKKLVNNIAKHLKMKHNTPHAGLQILSGNHLAKLLGKRPFETQHQVGLCVAVGDRRGPIENWSRVYEAKTILINKDLLLLENIN